MPYNGVGIFTQLYNWVTDKANGVFVTASRFQATYDDMAQALSNGVTRDGQSPALADIPMGGFKITNLAAGVAGNDAATVAQVGVPTVSHTSRVTRQGAAQTIGSGAAATVIFNTTIFDPSLEWNIATGVFTAALNGLYEFTVMLQVKVVTGGSTVILTPTMAGAGQSGLQFVPTVFNGQYQIFHATFVRNMVAGNTAFLQVTNNNPGNLTVEQISEAQITRIGN